MAGRAIGAFVLLLLVASLLLLGAPCLEIPANATAQSSRIQAEWLTQDPPPKEPSRLGPTLPVRWEYSDLVCTGVAEPPQLTGKIECIEGRDRDQLSARVTLETCFKGSAPVREITVLGDSLWVEKEVGAASGTLGSLASPGFVAPGRNLFFLRKADSPSVWRVTIPIYECAIPLAGTTPQYQLDGSTNSIREALGAEIAVRAPSCQH